MQNSDKLSDGENEIQRTNLHMKLSKTVSKMQIEEMANARKSELTHTHTHTHTRLMALFPGLPRWAGTRKVKPIWIY